MGAWRSFVRLGDKPVVFFPLLAGQMGLLFRAFLPTVSLG